MEVFWREAGSNTCFVSLFALLCWYLLIFRIVSMGQRPFINAITINHHFFNLLLDFILADRTVRIRWVLCFWFLLAVVWFEQFLIWWFLFFLERWLLIHNRLYIQIRFYFYQNSIFVKQNLGNNGLWLWAKVCYWLGCGHVCTYHSFFSK